MNRSWNGRSSSSFKPPKIISVLVHTVVKRNMRGHTSVVLVDAADRDNGRADSDGCSLDDHRSLKRKKMYEAVDPESVIDLTLETQEY